MFSAALACTAMIDGALSGWLRIGKVDPPRWCPVFPYGVAAVAAGEPAHSKPRGIKFLHLNLPATSKKHGIYWLSEGRFREGYSVHPAVTSLSPPWTPSTLQWPRFPLSIAVGVGPGSGSPQSVMFLRVSTRTMTRARFQIGNQLPIWNFGGMDASMLLMPLMACILRPSRRQYRRPALPQLPPAQSGRRQSFVVRASAGSSSPHTAHAIDNVFRPAAPMPSKSSWA